ncbi:MAG: MGMT family protein [Deltaproteobacteria bacterium]|nr:MGMT family protein [Deltaproteobacteria bacterium]
MAAGTFARIYRVVRCIPRGRVMTYGEVARRAGLPRGARTVGRAMAASPEILPWQRVVGLRRAGIAHLTIRDPLAAGLQRALLTREGVRYRRDGGIDLARFGWLQGTRPPPIRGGRGGGRRRRRATTCAARRSRRAG